MSSKSNKHLILKSFSLAICLLAASNNVCAQVPCGGYEVTAIIQTEECPPFGFPGMVPDGMNDLGWVVGHFNACVIGPDVSWLWTPENGLELLDMPPNSSQSRAIDINNHPDRQIVGTVDISDVGPRAFLIDGEDLILIEPPNNGTFSSVAAINNQRQIVGNTADGSPFSKAYIWEDGAMTIIEPTFGPRSAARDINEAGVVVGWMGISTNVDSHAFTWNNGKLEDIGIAPNAIATNARGINNIGQVLIWSLFGDGGPEGRLTGSFIWEDGEFIDLGGLPLYDVINGRDLNSHSQVVGMARAVNSSDEPDIGFIWQDGVFSDLNDLIPLDSGLRIARGEAISNDGQIIGFGEDEKGDVVGYVLTPIEQPVGDQNNDCQVSVEDLLLLLSAWGTCPNCKNCDADLNNDCEVSTYDLLILFSNWG